ncbi:MAG: hypothetical protein PWQ31_56 [Eubacteriales bacterium]|nr:hypothetical protein [Eubacteriales bacterium]
MKKIVIAGRNDSGKSTVLGEIYRGLKNRNFQPLAVGSGVQDEKPYLLKGIEHIYLTIAPPNPGEDVVRDIDRVIRNAVNVIREKNNLIQHARRALDELNKVRSVLELGHLSQKDIPKMATLPDVVLIEAVGINDGYKSKETREMADILISVVPADIKNEIIMEPGNVLLDQADIIVVTKIDIVPRNVTQTTVKLLQRIFPHKLVFPVVATDGVHMDMVVDEVVRRLTDPVLLLEQQEDSQAEN